MSETEQRNINPAALPDFHTSSGDVLFCPLSVHYPLSAFVHGDFRKWQVATCSNIMEAIRGLIFPLFIRMSVIRGSTVCNTAFQWTRASASVLRFTYIACLVYLCIVFATVSIGNGVMCVYGIARERAALQT
jgi:hypothetical protein